MAGGLQPRKQKRLPGEPFAFGVDQGAIMARPHICGDQIA